MTTHQLRLHGPSGGLEVELDGDTSGACLDRLQEWMREGALVELRTRRGTARVDMRQVWAVEFIPSGREIST